MSYNPGEVVTDGPVTAPRYVHHCIKVLIAIAIYAALRDALHWKPWFAAVAASPFFMVVVTVHEWIAPSDPNEHTYSLELRVDDFMTDLSCTVPAVALALFALHRWGWAIFALWAAGAIYLVCRENARP